MKKLLLISLLATLTTPALADQALVRRHYLQALDALAKAVNTELTNEVKAKEPVNKDRICQTIALMERLSSDTKTGRYGNLIQETQMIYCGKVDAEGEEAP